MKVARRRRGLVTFFSYVVSFSGAGVSVEVEKEEEELEEEVVEELEMFEEEEVDKVERVVLLFKAAKELSLPKLK